MSGSNLYGMRPYEQVFNQRGNRYDQAMREYPSARRREISLVLNHVDWDKIHKLLDIPAGGGYLRPYLPGGVELTEVEPSRGFWNIDADPEQIYRGIECADNTFDCVVCLAALHHIESKTEFLHECLRVLKQGGFLCIGDVKKASAEAEFLEATVHRHSATGHRGDYIDLNFAEGDKSYLQAAELLDIQYKACPWVFADRQSMTAFCGSLFGLQGITPDELFAALQNTVGVHQEDQQLLLGWHLLYLTLQKR